MIVLYRFLTFIASPFVPLLLKRRLARGKEDAARLPERMGVASRPRPSGKLMWIHAASIGEANAVLPLIVELLKQHEQLHILLTTVTVTSAKLMGAALPERAMHQFAPVDTPQAVNAFLNHWRPDLAFWVDSEIWPNMIYATHARGTVMGIVNARMSERSFNRWRRLDGFMRGLLSSFTFCFAQSEADAQRLQLLGMKSITRIGNLKYDAPPLPCDENELMRLRAMVKGRPVWVAASTHPGEEASIAQIHTALKSDGTPKVLTIVVPRHASRAEEVARALAPLHTARRSERDPILDDTDVYLADTMGELGLFYRLASVAFIGGSLVPHGGQNPLEAARLGCAVIAGPHMENFADIASSMQQDGALLRVSGAGELALELKRLLPEGAARAGLAAAAQAHVRAREGILNAVTQELQPWLSGGKT